MQNSKELFDVGVKYLKSKDYDLAIEHFGKAEILSLTNNDINDLDSARKGLARTYFEKGNRSEALKKFEKLVRTTNNIDIKDYALSRIAVIYGYTGEHKRAISFFEQITNLNNIRLINYARVYYQQNRFNKRKSALGEAVHILNKVDYDNATDYEKGLFNNLYGLISLAQGKFDTSLDYLTKTLKLAKNEEMKNIWLTDLVELYLNQNLLEKAKEVLNSITLKNETSRLSGLFYKMTGILHSKLGNEEQAKIYLLKSLDIIINKGLYKHAAEILELLAKITKNENFYDAAIYFSNGMNYINILEGRSGLDEETTRLLDSCYAS